MVRVNHRPRATASPRNRGPTPGQWAEIQPEVYKLYIVQGKQLPEVMTILASQNFHASPSAFKRKLEFWGFEKKNKEINMIALIRKSKEAAARGEQRRYRIRGKYVDVETAYRYFERRNIKRDYWDNREIAHSTTPKYIESFPPSEASTPPTSTDSSDGGQLELADRVLADVAQQQLIEDFMKAVGQQYISLPATPPPPYLNRASANLVQSVDRYFGTKLSSGDWTLATRNRNIDESCPSMHFGSLFLKYHNMLQMSDYSEAHSSLLTAFGMVKRLLEVQDPRLLIYFLESLAFCRASGYDVLANNINVYFMAQSQGLFGVEHPLTVFCAALLHTDRAYQDAFIEIGLKSMLHQYLSYLRPPYDLETTSLLLTGAMIMKHLKFYRTASEFLDQLLPMYLEIYGETSCQTVQCLIDRAHVLLAIEDLTQAETLIVRAMRLAEGITDANELGESKIRCLVCLAVLRQKQGDLLANSFQLKLALEVGKALSLEEDHWAMRDVRGRIAGQS